LTRVQKIRFSKVGAGGTAMVVVAGHGLTLRTKGRCGIKPRSAPELGR